MDKCTESCDDVCWYGEGSSEHGEHDAKGEVGEYGHVLGLSIETEYQWKVPKRPSYKISFTAFFRVFVDKLINSKAQCLA